jgi:hypothetical protein
MSDPIDTGANEWGGGSQRGMQRDAVHAAAM